MKFLSLSALVGLAAASPIAAPAGCSTAPGGCTIPGSLGMLSSSHSNNRIDVFTGTGASDPEAFAVRKASGSNGACSLWDYALPFRAPEGAETSNTYYYNLPDGIVGWVPENVAQHYKADTSKTKGNYKDCRALCISEPTCKGFGFKSGGNCQLYDVSLAGKVKARSDSPYIHYQLDCTAAPIAPVPY
ncbi:hypothetical protein LCI18_003590 [Fusarium solani-melongenae]|uniref:Uncharacterized protein n=1 Tax=Fusarium solani subsp. cucurbitae TaxID=2747967 RepID=A0ACD3YUM5_FUSSC|nr:hypothetical protein LCI18_003590 [Fusarium solani-melongenae]